MKKGKHVLFLIFMTLCLMMSFFTFGDTGIFTEEEQKWIDDHKDEVLKLGLDPYSGMDYFEFKGQQHGYVIDVADLIERETGLTVEIVGDKTWGEVYQGLQDSEIDILFGANVTEERLEFMSFTQPIHKYPYAIFTSDQTEILTLGDLEYKNIGFIEGDIAIELFTELYEHLQFKVVEFDSQPEGLEGLQSEAIDAFITSGGGIVYDFLYHYSNINYLTEIRDITSDMTLATRKENQILADILSKVIEDHADNVIPDYIHEAEVIYNHKILNLTDEELDWLKNDGVAVVGIVSDYLPFDHYEDGEYKGVAGEIINEIERIVGIEFEFEYGDFDTIYEKAKTGEVEVLNIAKTDDRLIYFSFPTSYSEERDQIYGQKSSEHVSDIYGLEGKKVAVIKGFWHEEFLLKNLRDVQIIKTDSIQQSLKYVNSGRVDYFIENPTVAEYYISGLGYWDIVKKGETSTDSFLYFGVTINEPILSSILDKTLKLIDYDKAKQIGLDTVPGLMSRSVFYLIWVILGLLLVISVVIYILFKAMRTLIKERETSAVLKEREHLMYLDPLTGLNNRLYYNSIEMALDEKSYPQALIIMDLNNLKEINDTYGHHMGDDYIKTFGDILKSVAGDEIVCRMGGDEFVIILVGCGEPCIMKLESLIRERMAKITIGDIDKKMINVSAAFGYGMRYDHHQSLEEIMIHADNNMYLDKNRYKRRQ